MSASSDRLRRIGDAAATANRVMLPLAAAALLLAVIDVSDWNEGVTRAAALAVGAATLGALWRAPLPALPGRAAGWLAVVVVAVALQLVQAWPQMTNPKNRPNDIGFTTQAAIHAMQRRESIYRAPVDDQYGEGTGFHHFCGYKYGPIVPRFYYPFMRLSNETRGLYLGNAALLVITVVAAAVLAARGAGGSAAAGVAAAALILWPRFVRFELFVQGANDLLPTALALLALLACAFEGPLAAGVAVGLSLACKPLPGALIVPLLPWRSSARRLAIGLALGLVVLVPDFVRAPREMIANLVLFSLSRPGDSTSLLEALPPWAHPVVQLAGVAVIVALVIAYHRRAATPQRLVVAAACVVAVFLVVSKIIHRNYVLWWLPLAAAAIGATCYRQSTTTPTRAEA